MRDVVLRMAVIAGVFVSAQALSAQSLTPEGYVDPHVAGRDRCLDHPGRPGWMMVQPVGFGWRLQLANDFRSFHRRVPIAELERCDCDLFYPDWDAYRHDLEALWDYISDAPKYEWDEAARTRYFMSIDTLTSVSYPLASKVADICNLE